MKNIANKILAVIFVFFIFASFSSAQTGKKDAKAIVEITDLRRQAVAAIEKRDRKTLEAIYAEDFSHTHASGKVDDRKTRLDVYVSGEKTIDTAEAEDLKIKIFGKNTAVATGKSAVKGDEGKTAVYRWTIVYAKIGRRWQISASQATKIMEIE